MKKSIIVAPVFILMTMTFTSCNFGNTKEENLQDAKDEVTEAKKDLEEAKQAYLLNVETYRQETLKKIAANDKSIAEYKVRIATEKRAVRNDYERNIAVLDNKNSDLRRRMDEYKADNKETWEDFKEEFGKEMNDLDNSFKKLTKSDN